MHIAGPKFPKRKNGLEYFFPNTIEEDVQLYNY